MSDVNGDAFCVLRLNLAAVGKASGSSDTEGG